MSKFFKYTWVPFSIAVIIFYLTCLIPANDIPDVGFDFFIPIDKIVHFLMFFGLSGATGLFYVYGKKGNINNYKLVIGAIIIPIIYGGIIEIIQSNFFPPRTGDWFDFIADTCGSLSAIFIILSYRYYLLKRQKVVA